MYMIVYLHVCPMNAAPTEARRGMLEPLRLELQIMMSHHVIAGY